MLGRTEHYFAKSDLEKAERVLQDSLGIVLLDDPQFSQKITELMEHLIITITIAMTMQTTLDHISTTRYSDQDM